MKCSKCGSKMKEGGCLPSKIYLSCPKCDWPSDDDLLFQETLELPLIDSYEYLFSSITDIAFLRKALSAMLKNKPWLKMPRRCPAGYGHYTTLRVPKKFILAYDADDALVDCGAPFEILDPAKGTGLGEWESL